MYTIQFNICKTRDTWHVYFQVLRDLRPFLDALDRVARVTPTLAVALALRLRLLLARE